MRVPNSWKGVTVEQFQELLPIYKKAIEEKDSVKAMTLWANIIAILADCQTDEVEALPLDELKKIIKSLKFLGDNKIYASKKFTLYLNGKLYKAPKDAKEFNTARYVEFKTFLGRGGMIDELHNLLACIYQPYFKSDQTHTQRAIEFKKASVKDVYGVVFFYTKVYKNSIRRIQEYGIKVLKEKQREIDQHLMETLREILEGIGDGTSQSMNSQVETLLKKMS